MALSLRRYVLVGCLLGSSPLLHAAERPGAEPTWAQSPSGHPQVQWGAARSQSITAGGRAKAASVRLTTAVVAERHLVLAVWPIENGKLAAWFGERLAPPQAKAPALVTLWQGKLGAQDADGEVRTVVELTQQGLLRYQQAVGLRHCSGQASRLFVERFDHKQKRFVPFEMSAEPPAAQPLVPQTQPPTLAGETSAWPQPRDVGFRFTAASAPVRTPRDARSLQVPFALTNPDGSGAWVLSGDQATSAFATARAPLPLPVAGLLLESPPRVSWPAHVRLTLGPTQAFVVDLQGVQDAARVWVALPQPVESSCLTIEVAGAQTAARMGLSYVGVVTAWDGPQGPDLLADRLAAGQNCDALVRSMTVQAMEAAVVASALVARLPSASALGQLCVVQALSGLPAASVPAAAEWLPQALPTLLFSIARVSDPAQRASQLALVAPWLKQAGAPAAQALAEMLRAAAVATETKALAARLMSQTTEATFQVALMDAALAIDLTELAALRSAVAGSAAAWGPRLEAALIQTDPEKQPGRAERILWLLQWHKRLNADRRSWLSIAQKWAQSPSLAFAVRARAVGALGAAGGQAQSTLAGLVNSDPDPVLRFLALQALAQGLRNAPSDPAVYLPFKAALLDRDPRVRQTAAYAWATAPVPVARKHLPTLVQAFKLERWPFVMPAHLQALGHTCAAQPQLLSALQQTDLMVDAHVVALESLAACQLPAAREQALHWIKRQSAALPVRLAAAQALASVATPDDAQTLLRTLTQLAKAAAFDPVLDELAVAVLQALTPLHEDSGVQAAKALLKITRARPRQAALDALASLCVPAATAELARQSKSDDAGLAAAARRSLHQCESQER